MQVGVIPSHGWGPNRNQLLSIAATLIQILTKFYRAQQPTHQVKVKAKIAIFP
jgi:hypothetical protein